MPRHASLTRASPSLLLQPVAAQCEPAIAIGDPSGGVRRPASVTLRYAIPMSGDGLRPPQATRHDSRTRLNRRTSRTRRFARAHRQYHASRPRPEYCCTGKDRQWVDTDQTPGPTGPGDDHHHGIDALSDRRRRHDGRRGRQAIRERDADGSIVLVGAGPIRPTLDPHSRRVCYGTDEAKIWRGTDAAGADLRLGRRIVSLDLEGRRAIDDAGDEYAWERLLLATGGRPRTIPGTDGVVYYRTLDDYREVRARVHSGTRAVVIGGGFIGSEIAASLAANDCRVTMVFPESGIASRVLPASSRSS